jgi:histidine triad (HIT) family protein
MSETIFQKIAARKIPAKIVHEDDQYMAIEDISPEAPVHILIFPKRVIPTLNDLKPGDDQLVGGMFLLASAVMKKLGQTDFRTVFNCGVGAGQTVFHLHLHVMAGRAFSWPPG